MKIKTKKEAVSVRDQQKKRFRGWRNDNGLTIQRVADLVGAPVSTVIKWNDGAIPSRLYQRELQRTFGVSVASWF